MKCFPDTKAFTIYAVSLEQSTTMVPNLGSPDVLGLQLREILASIVNSEGLWVF